MQASHIPQAISKWVFGLAKQDLQDSHDLAQAALFVKLFPRTVTSQLLMCPTPLDGFSSNIGLSNAPRRGCIHVSFYTVLCRDEEIDNIWAKETFQICS